jgi:hypothetical protein
MTDLLVAYLIEFICLLLQVVPALWVLFTVVALIFGS